MVALEDPLPRPVGEGLDALIPLELVERRVVGQVEQDDVVEVPAVGDVVPAEEPDPVLLLVLAHLPREERLHVELEERVAAAADGEIRREHGHWARDLQDPGDGQTARRRRLFSHAAVGRLVLQLTDGRGARRERAAATARTTIRGDEAEQEDHRLPGDEEEQQDRDQEDAAQPGRPAPADAERGQDEQGDEDDDLAPEAAQARALRGVERRSLVLDVPDCRRGSRDRSWPKWYRRAADQDVRAHRGRLDQPRQASPPPSTTRVVPVTHDAASDARKATARAESSGVPSRRIGRSADRDEERREILAELRRLAPEERSVGVSGADAVDPDPLRPVVDRHRPGQVHHGPLRRAVAGRAGTALEPPARTDVDHDAAAAEGHLGDRVPAQQEDGLDVDRHDPVPFLLRRLDDIGAANDPRRVDDDVEPAERGDGSLDQPPAVGLDGHVAVDGCGTPAVCGDGRDRVRAARRRRDRRGRRPRPPGPAAPPSPGRCRTRLP